MTCDKISSICKINPNFTNEILENLYKNKFVNRQCIAQSNGISVSSINHYYVTNLGNEYFNMKRKEAFSQFQKSIICPIIVSILTTKITLIVDNLIPKLLSHLLSS